MNINEISSSNIVANLSYTDGGVILYYTDNTHSSIALHNYSRSGECHSGSYYTTDEIERAREDLEHSVCNAIASL